jgi:polar amino acid transport system substrate-binding protein
VIEFMRKLLFTLIVLPVMFITPAFAELSPGTTIDTCNDGGGWPPYLYYEREKTNKIAGYDIDYLANIVENESMGFTFELIAWSRCLHDVETGEKYKMAYSDERAKTYLASDPYYIVQPHYFYAKANYPTGLEISSLAEFSNYKVCGLRGYNYANFGIDVDFI